MANWLRFGFKPVYGDEATNLFDLHPYYGKKQLLAGILGYLGIIMVAVSIGWIGKSLRSIPSSLWCFWSMGITFYVRVCGRFILRAVWLEPDLETQVRLCREVVKRRESASTRVQRLSASLRAYVSCIILGSPWHEASELKALGDVCVVSYDTTGQMELLEEALRAYERCLHLRPYGHNLHGLAVRDLSLALWRHCRDNNGDNTKLNQCLEMLRKTIDLHPTAREVWMPYHASALIMQFKQIPQQDLTLLAQAIELYRETLRLRSLAPPALTARDEFLLWWRLLYEEPELWPAPRPTKDLVLSRLGCALLILFQEQGSPDTLEEAITLLRRALQLRQKGHPARYLSLHHLATALHVLCEERGDSSVAEEAIVLYEEALRLSNGLSGGVSRGALLDGFGIAFITRFRLHPDLDVLTKSVLLLKEALRLHPQDRFARIASLRHIGDALRIRAEERGEWNALDDAISQYREALQLSSGMGHDPVRDEVLNGLGIALLVRFRQTGSLDDLTEAIVFHREALQLQRSAHHTRGFSLNYLALGLLARSHQQGGLADLDEAIGLLREAVRHCRLDHPVKRNWLNSLAGALQVRFERQGGMEILEESVALRREALDVHSAGHSARDNVLSSLGSALQTRFEQQGDAKMLEEAVAFHREALTFYSGYHPGRYIRLNNLACAIKALFNQAREVNVLSQAIDLYREALQLCPEGHPRRAHSLFGLGECHLTRQADQTDFILGIACLSEALAHFTTSVWERIIGAVASLRVVEREHSASLKRGDASRWTQHAPHILKLYRRAVQLLPLAANLGLDPRTRLEVGSGSDELSRRGAARAVLINHVAEAVEMLEEGRGLFWSQLLHLRSSALDGVPEDDRRRLESMFRDLETTSNTFIVESERDREQRLEQRRLLNVQTEEAITKIRAHYPGFDRLLMPPAFDELMSSLPEGFVVIVNTARPSHHALLLHRSSGLATSVTLRAPRGGFDCDDIRAHMPRDLCVGTKETEHEIDSGDRGTNIRREEEFDSFDDVLAGLWERVVQPVIVSLSLQVSVTYLVP
jgi:tetratricopeptide (TPR) repeat protein